MVNWNSILQFWVYPIAVLAPILDGLSTYLLLKHTDGQEKNSRVAYFHNRFGLAKGQAMWSLFATPLWVGGIFVVITYSGLALACLAAGVYFGFSLKQLYDGYTAYILAQ